MSNKTIQYYNNNAERWAETKTNSFHHELQFRKFIRHFHTGDTILDIGCAYGIHVPLFLGVGRKCAYEGIDASKHMIKLSQSRYPQLSFRLADISKRKTLPRKTYAGFWSVAVLMHLPEKNLTVALDNIESRMKSGAVGYITFPLKRPGHASRKDQRHFTLFPKGQFKTILTERGWRVLETGIIHGSHKPNIWEWFIVQLP
jgi:SAM-dependent methyltransferase